MLMQSFEMRPTFVSAVAVSLVSCQTMGHEVLTDAHALYQRGDNAGAAQLYEDVVATSSDLTSAYFYLGNSYDNLYRSARRGETDNGRLLELAIDNYLAAVDRATGPARLTQAMRYLAVAYGPDKANDPASAEPLLQELIRADPSNPDPYLALAKLREKAGRRDEAEQMLLRAGDLGEDAGAYLELAGFYSRSQQFEQAIEALRMRAMLEPDNPEAFYTIGTYYWEKVFRDSRLTDEEEEEYVVLGLRAVDRALMLNADYVDALVYKNILTRMQANKTEDDERRAQLVAEADRLRNRAVELAGRRR